MNKWTRMQVKEEKTETVTVKKELKEVSDNDLEIAENNVKAFLEDFSIWIIASTFPPIILKPRFHIRL